MKLYSYLIAVALAFSCGAWAQDVANIHLKDGRTIAASGLQRNGNDVMVSATSGPAGGQVGYALDTIARIDFSEPGAIKGAGDLFADGKISDGIVMLKPVLDYYAPFRDIQGSWWTKAALLEVNALINTGREADAGSLISQLEQCTGDPEAVCVGQVQEAAAFAREGRYTLALPQLETAIKNTSDKDTLAQAWYNKGICLLALRRWEPAVMAYLRIPVFYSNNKVLVAPALLGGAMAMVGMQDIANARVELQEIITDYPNSPEAGEAKVELGKLNQQKPVNTADKSAG